jgi:hypothetical protein
MFLQTHGLPLVSEVSVVIPRTTPKEKYLGPYRPAPTIFVRALHAGVVSEGWGWKAGCIPIGSKRGPTGLPLLSPDDSLYHLYDALKGLH